MKYQTSITVAVPLNRFVELLDNPENMRHWQRGLQSYELLQGDPGTEGATMRLDYLHGKKAMSLVETITKNNLPHEFSATYECPGVWNHVINRFHENAQGQTVWEADNVFKFTGMMRLMSWFMPTSMFKKQSCQYLADFKAFAEGGRPLAD
ncbi:SRPBCC family protein [Marinicella meishanensis]|uniref:SRPBCC family protein n=1 Tax=Marinicella meishanensis TaxID=2873263 RepID=UPI001CBC8679|nr:SRPBCC family protein [Marinicella sp. NBU2979]